MEIAEIRVKLMYARNFTPHKIAYWEDRLQTAELELIEANKRYKDYFKHRPKKPRSNGDEYERIVDFQR